MSPKSFYVKWLDKSASRPRMGQFGAGWDGGYREASEIERRNSLSRFQLDQSDTVGVVGTENAKRDRMGMRRGRRGWQPADRTDLR
jgi:hypothetical protein